MAWYWWLIIAWTVWACVEFRRVWNRHDFLWWSFPIIFFAMYIWAPMYGVFVAQFEISLFLNRRRKKS